jgi:uncharacterized protein YdeI (YjbR/CyaY-like superfamily)
MYEQMTFSNEIDFRSWLSQNHNSCDGVWLVFGKTKELKTLSYDDALKHALCYGWIDSQIKKIDDIKYIQKFTPRRKKSKWSKRNKLIIQELIQDKLMMPQGYAAIKRAKNEGMWESQVDEFTDDDIEKLADKLKGHNPAYDNFMKMSLSIRRTYTRHYLDAKKEDTRTRRLSKIIERLNQNLKPM